MREVHLRDLCVAALATLRSRKLLRPSGGDVVLNAAPGRQRRSSDGRGERLALRRLR
jgi:hypothetical protein